MEKALTKAPCRGVLSDCKIFANLSFEVLLLTLTSLRVVEGMTRGPAPRLARGPGPRPMALWAWQHRQQLQPGST